MIDFIAKISFDNTLKDKKPYLYPNPKAKQTSRLIRSYEDDKVQIKYSTQVESEFIRKTNDKKFLVLASIHEGDRANLNNNFKTNDIEMKSDPEILLDLYLEHGEDALKILSYGFIFILIDYKNNTVRAYRDHIGIKNLCYYQLGTSIYLASSFRNLFKLSHLHHTLNQNKVNNFLRHIDNSASDTFTNEIKKVPPMNALEFCGEKINIYEYSKYEINRIPMSHSNQVEELKRLLMKSVAIEERSMHSKIGFLFSGGIDSSTIITFFKKQKRVNEKIFAFSAQYNHIDKSIKHLIDETEFQNEILQLEDVNEFSFNGEDDSTLSNLDFYLEIIGQPFFFPNLYISKKAFELAYENNIGIVMNGSDGDSIVSHGYEYLIELFYSLRWLKLYKEISSTSKVRKQSMGFIIDKIILKNISFKNFLHRSSKKKHLSVVMSNNHNKAIEIHGLLASYYGIEERHPFYNRDVIEHCLNISPELKHKDGHSRYVLQQAIKGMVPEKIRTRTTKSNLGHALCIGYTNKDYNIIQEQLHEPHPAVKAVIDIDDLQKSFQNLLQDPRKHATRSMVPSKIFSYTVLNKWLNNNF